MNEIHIKSDAKYIDIHHNDVVNVDISTKESVNEELEEAAKKHSCYNEDCEGAFYEPLVRNAFIAGANWQEEKDNICYEEIFEEGAAWKYEQMMKDAVKVSIVNAANVASESQDICGKYFSCVGSFKEDEYCPSLGDKVKLIIVKED